MTWSGGYTEWTEGQHAYLSVVFSWQLAKAVARASQLESEGYHVHIGGPAAVLNPERTGTWLDLSPQPALQHHNPDAVFTTRGCIRSCPFCAVATLEGSLVELTDWEPKPIICDNNLLAASRIHFDRVMDRLQGIKGVDFNQGLDARLLRSLHVDALRSLDIACIRLAWDDTRMESAFRAAMQLLEGIPRRKLHVYVLIGYNDTPEDALYRLETVRSLGVRPNPMRYQPHDCLRRNAYVAPGWTDKELKRYMRYWSRLRWLEHVPFSEFRSRGEDAEFCKSRRGL